jgi:hypothetical protein
VLSGFVDVDVMDPPPDLPRQALIPADVSPCYKGLISD